MTAWPWPRALGIASSVSGTEPYSWTLWRTTPSLQVSTVRTTRLLYSLIMTHSCEEAQADSTGVRPEVIEIRWRHHCALCTYICTVYEYKYGIYVQQYVHVYAIYMRSHNGIVYIFVV